MSGDPGSDGFVPPPVRAAKPTTARASGQLVRRETLPSPVRRADGAVVRASTGARAPRGQSVVWVVGVVRRAVTHERTATGVRWLARNLVLYVLTGARIVIRRLWEARTNSRYERLMRAAETVGDYDRLTDWEARAEQARERRHRQHWTGCRHRSRWCGPSSSRS